MLDCSRKFGAGHGGRHLNHNSSGGACDKELEFGVLVSGSSHLNHNSPDGACDKEAGPGKF